MKVTIITTCYNSAATIRDSIMSVKTQSYRNIEHLIIDGASKDNSLDIVESLKGSNLKIISEPDKGIYDAMNKGILHASGQILAFLNSDDFYTHNDVISNVVDVFVREQCDAVYGDLYYVDYYNTSHIKRRWVSGNWRPRSFLFGWMPPHPTFFVKKSVYEKYGNFNTLLKSAADYEIMLRFLHRFKIKAVYMPDFLVKMRIGGISNASLKNRLRANKEDRLSWQLNGLKPYFFTTWLKPIRKIGQFIGNSGRSQTFQ